MGERLEIPLAPTWDAFGHRLAALAGAAAGLVALLAGAPVTVACLRGTLTWVAALAAAWLARALLLRLAPTESSARTRLESATEGSESDSTLKPPEGSAR